MVKFFERTTIHGVYDLVSAKKTIEKVTWALILILAVGFLIFGLTRTIIDYTSEPTAVEILQIPPERFPEIVYCPVAWTNGTRWKLAGFNEDDYIFAETRLRRTRLIKELINRVIKNNESYLFNRIIPQKFHRILTAANISFNQLLLDTSYDTRRVMKVKLESKRNRQNVTKFLTIGGVCYSYHKKLDSRTKWYLSNQMFTLYQQELILSKFENDRSDAIAIGPRANSSVPTPLYPLSRGTHTARVYLTATKVHKTNTKSKRCYKWDPRDQINCRMDCMSAFCLTKYNCSHHNPSIETSVYNYCTIMKRASCLYDLNVKLEHIKTCKNCLPACDEYFYQTTIFKSVPRSKHNAANSSSARPEVTLIVGLLDPYSTLVMYEKKMYSWETFLSNIGGQISLWCGGSVISILQSIYFCSRYFRKSSKRRQRQREDKYIVPIITSV